MAAANRLASGRDSAGTELARYWPLVLAASIGFSFASLMTPTLGVFMAPLHEEFGWNRAQLTLGVSLIGILGLGLAPLAGITVDRLGSRRMALPGLVLTGAAIAAFSLLEGGMTQWLAQWIVFALCAMLIQTTVWSTAVARSFDQSRGLALGIVLSGSAISQIVSPPLSNWLIDNFGWRAAFVWLGFGWCSVPFLLCYFFLKPGGEPAGDTARSAECPDLPGLTIPQAWRDTALWRVAIATLLILSITIAVSVHQIPIYIEAGVTKANAAWLASLAGAAAIFGKLVTGALVDRFHVRWVGGVTLAMTAVAYPLLMEAASLVGWIVLACLISGYASGTKIQLCGYLTSRYAGMRNFGTIFGVMSSVIALASAVGPLVAGWAYDMNGNYDTVLLVGTAISLISGALIFSLGRYPDWTRDEKHAKSG